MDGKEGTTKALDKSKKIRAVQEYGSLISHLDSVSGRDILNSVLDRERPHELVRALSSEDFYWLVKKIGEDDGLPLLALASEEQWQFLLDLELWNEDRLDETKTFQWISRLQQADLMRVVQWIFGEGQALGYMYLFRHLEVAVKTEEDGLPDLPEGFLTLDGVYYFRPVDRSQSPEFEKLLKAMAAEDRLRYQAMMAGLGGLIPAEAEEEMYRMRGVRLAEHGFLPREEALSIYSPLPVSAAVRGAPEGHLTVESDLEIIHRGAVAPLIMTPASAGMFGRVAFSIDDPALLDRIRLEFSGLCNLIISADRIIPGDLRDLETICGKAAGYVNVALEHLCGEDFSLAMAQVRETALFTLFRIGLGLAMEVGRRAVHWSSTSWWKTSGMEYSFWGDDGGKFLQGLMKKRPLFYSGAQENEEFRDFRSIGEVARSALELEKIIALDHLLGKLETAPKPMPAVPEITAQAVLITLWARAELGLERKFSALPPDEARRLLTILKGGASRRKWLRKDFRGQFTRFFTTGSRSSGSEPDRNLREALWDIWDEFRDEYGDIRALDLDARFSRLILIEPSGEDEPV